MTRKWIAIIVLLTLAVGSGLLPADEQSALRAVATPGVVLDKWGYKLKLTRLETKCNMALGKNPKRPSTFSLDIEASCKMPDDVDGVLITEQIKVLKALSADGKDLRLPPKAKSRRSPAKSKYRNGTFTPILHVGKKLRIAEVKINKLELTTNPYKIYKLETELALVVAVQRTEKRMPALVSQTLGELTPDLKARVSSMKISEKREMKLELTCLRRYAGPKGSFIEAVTAIDANGKRIGGARINQGDPLGQKGKLSVIFTLTGKNEPATLEVTIVTESKIRKIPFEITGIFQK
jgi:hypothetical protein